MKKLLSIFAALMIIFTFSLPAFATDTADTADTADTIDTSNWITHEIPELGISLALPQGTKVYTRDSLAKGNLDNDPNYDKAVEDFKLESRYFWALNLEENIDLDLKVYHEMPHIYPFSSTKTLPRIFANNLIDGLNDSSDSEELYSTLSISNNVFIVHPRRYKFHYVYYLYNSMINNISYCFDFRMEADSGVDKPSEIYNAILSTVDFSNVPTDIYSSLPVLLVLLLAAVFLVYRFFKFKNFTT